MPEGALVTRAPAADGVGMEVGHRISVDTVHLEPVAHVYVAVVPDLSGALPRSIDDVAVEGEANWGQGLGDARYHVGHGVACTVAGRDAAGTSRRGLLGRRHHAGRETLEVVVALGRVSSTKALVNFLLSIGWHIGAGVEQVHIIG